MGIEKGVDQSASFNSSAAETESEENIADQVLARLGLEVDLTDKTSKGTTLRDYINNKNGPGYGSFVSLLSMEPGTPEELVLREDILFTAQLYLTEDADKTT